jgi:hypothetical protein
VGSELCIRDRSYGGTQREIDSATRCRNSTDCTRAWRRGGYGNRWN